MVRSEKAPLSSLLFSGTSDGRTFFFFYETVACGLHSEGEMATVLLAYLQEAAFESYYDHFSDRGVLANEA